MKAKLRVLGFLLAICVLICSLTSCSTALLWDFFWNAFYEEAVAQNGSLNNGEDAQTSTQPDKVVSDLEYCLTLEDVDAFYELLETCKQAFLSAESTEAELDALEQELTDAYYHIVTQSQLAYIHYCMATQDDDASADYLFSSEASAETYDAYMQMCKAIDASDSTWRDYFFAEWSSEELEEMRGFSQELTELNKENDLLLVAYRDLDEETSYLGASDYYTELVENNNRIAELKGYGNYWEYAYAEVYGRDYGKNEITQMRTFVKVCLVELCADALAAFQQQYSRLSRSEKAFVEDFLWEANYDDFATDYVGNYLSTFGEEAENAMKGMFDEKNSVFTSSENAYAGAFTTYLYGLKRPICYFGPGYQSASTVVHELGHYYSYLLNGTADVQMDLAEVQSQGNEWLFYAYLNDALDQDVARAIYTYQLYSSLCTVIVGTMVDEFEQHCYEGEIASSDEADAVMAALMQEYGGREFLEYYVTDMDLYWRRVAVENSVYYVSYAVSMLAALQIYTVAENQSYEKGMEVYLSLMEPKSNSFLTCLAGAGLKTPMDEALYAELQALI